MRIAGIITEDFINYKKPCMTIQFPYCDFKCDKENGGQYCQNYALKSESVIDIPIEKIVNYYVTNTITKAIVFQGLEPFYNSSILYELIDEFRSKTDDTIIIYTGYTEEELDNCVKILKDRFKNIIIKFGRYKPNQEPHKDKILGVKLASDNQYAVRVC